MRSKSHGVGAIHTLGVLFVMLIMGAFAIDAGYYYVVQQGLRNSADAAALAGAEELFRNTSLDLDTRMASARTQARNLSQSNMENQLADADITFGYVDPITATYDQVTFTQPTNNPAFGLTGGYNAVRVNVKAGAGDPNAPIRSMFSKWMGFDNFKSAAQAIAIYGGGVTNASGLRPVYMCQTAWNAAIQEYGDPTAPEITFYGDTLRVGSRNINQADSCGSMGPGNWGLADLANSNGAPGVSDVKDWFANGYNGQVFTGKNYESQTGTPLNTFDDSLNKLKDNQTVIQIPLYDTTSGKGSNEVFHVSMIASFVITDFKTTGNQSQRYIKGYFRKSVCHSNCSLGNSIQGGGVTKLRLIR